jgi:hypothetical protein
VLFTAGHLVVEKSAALDAPFASFAACDVLDIIEGTLHCIIPYFCLN